MKILMIVPFLPNTSMSGGQTRWYNIIVHLSKNHEITLFSLIKDESERKFIPELEKYCRKVRVFSRPRSPWTLRNILLTAFTYYPLLVVRNLSIKEIKAIEEELRSEKYDLIHAETFYVMPHIPDVKVPSILVEQTIEYQVYKHYVDNEVPWFLRPIFMIDIMKLKYWELFYWKKTNQLVAVSESDKVKMIEHIPGIKVDVIPNGVDVSYFDEKPVSLKTPPHILFVGNFKWLQNVEALNLLIDEVWPHINKNFSTAKLWIVGKSIPQNVVHLSEVRDDIVVTEGIEDIRDAYKAATVMVVPLRGPGGTRLKVLEALASKLPVVSTSVGIEGLEVKPGYHAIVEDTMKGLAEKTVELLNDPERSKEIGINGYKFVKEHYDWGSLVKLHDKIYSNVINKK